MSRTLREIFTRLSGRWILVVLVIFVGGVRFHLREMPLERDEGEYAYAGQMILKGETPYKEVYNMKLPGTYACYAAIMAVFGQTPSGIRTGLILVNAISIILVFLIGRRLLDEITGVVAAVAFALLSLSPSVLGLAGHATHFLVLPALGGVLMLLYCDNGARSFRAAGKQGPRAREQTAFQQTGQGGRSQRVPTPETKTASTRVFLAGMLMGMAFVMKQHGLFFGLFGVAWLICSYVIDRLESRPSRYPLSAEQSLATSPNLSSLASTLGLFLGGLALPYAATCLVLWVTGAFPQFWFWTVSYAREYASNMPLVKGLATLKVMFRVVLGPNTLLWLLAAAGLGILWTDHRLNNRARAFVMLLGLSAIGAVSVGLYFRGHYFIPLLPVLGLLGGLAVSRSLWLLRNDRSIELFIAIPVLIALAVGVPLSLIGNGSVWFGSMEQAMRESYHTTLFTEAAKAAEYLRRNAATNARVAVVGSEPEIYFLSRRRAATGYIYMYPLVESQPFAPKMREQMIEEIERNRPEYVVYVPDYSSWLNEEKDPALMSWWNVYWEKNLEITDVYKVMTSLESDLGALESKVSGKPEREAPWMESEILVLRRKTGH